MNFHRILMVSLTLLCVWTIAGPLVSPSIAQPVDDLVLMTEQYPPYNFEEDGQIRGIAVDLILRILEGMQSTRSREDIKLVPWARGYRSAMTKPDICLFSTTRTKEREELFQWVGPIATNRVSLIARKDRKIRIQSSEQIQNYRIGTVTDDVAGEILAAAGVPKNRLESVALNVTNIMKLKRGRIDLWAYGENVAEWELKAQGMDPEDYETVYVLDEIDLYYVLHKDASNQLVDRMQAVLDSLKTSGEYRKILDKYLLPQP